MIKAYCIDNRDEFNADGNRALGTLLKFLRDRSERIDPFALAAQLESFNQSKETLMSVLACAAVRLEAAERENAAMRAFLEVEYEDRLAICRVVGAQTSARLEELKAALQPDAGRDFIPREQVQPLADAIRAISEAVDKMSRTKDRQELAEGFTAAETARRKGLAHAKTLGF